MEQIIEAKSILKDKNLLSVLAESVYNPTKERLSNQKSGIGSLLINHCIYTFQPNVIIAETDDDAVGFYKKNGFDILPLGDKYRYF